MNDKDWEPSAAAKSQNVCHTREECAQMYRAIPAEKKAPALELLRTTLAPGRQMAKSTYHMYDD